MKWIVSKQLTGHRKQKHGKETEITDLMLHAAFIK